MDLAVDNAGQDMEPRAVDHLSARCLGDGADLDDFPVPHANIAHSFLARGHDCTVLEDGVVGLGHGALR